MHFVCAVLGIVCRVLKNLDIFENLCLEKSNDCSCYDRLGVVGGIRRRVQSFVKFIHRRNKNGHANTQGVYKLPVQTTGQK